MDKVEKTMRTPFNGSGRFAKLLSIATVLANSVLSALILVVVSTANAALVTYSFTGAVTGGGGAPGSPGNSIPAGLQGQFSIGQPITLTYLVETSTPESSVTTGNSKFAYYPGAVISWSATFGSYTANGTGGYASVCDSGTATGSNPDCYTPYFPGITSDGMDGVRFVGWSPTLMGPTVAGTDGLVYYLCGPTNAAWLDNRQCANASVFDPTGAALTTDAIPPSLDPARFNGPNNARLAFTPVDPSTGATGNQVFVSGELSVVPEPGTLALLGLGLAGLAASRRRTQ